MVINDEPMSKAYENNNEYYNLQPTGNISQSTYVKNQIYVLISIK